MVKKTGIDKCMTIYGIPTRKNYGGYKNRTYVTYGDEDLPDNKKQEGFERVTTMLYINTDIFKTRLNERLDCTNPIEIFEAIQGILF